MVYRRHHTPIATELGFGKLIGALLLIIANISELIARLPIGIIGDFQPVNKGVMLATFYLIFGTVTLCATFLPSLPMMMGLSVCLGCLGTTYPGLLTPIILESIGSQFGGFIQGIKGTGIGLSSIVVPILAGIYIKQ